MRPAIAQTLLCVVATLAARAGRADLLDQTGGEAAALARANPVALGTGPVVAIAGNPALLPAAAVGSTGALLVVGSRLDVSLRARSVDLDVPDSIYGARQADGSAVPHYLATDDLTSPRAGANAGDELGLLFTSTRRLAGGRVAAGWLAYLPLSGATQRTRYADEREAPFSNSVRPILLEDDHGSAVVSGSAGFSPRPWITLGLGVKLLIGARTSTEVYVPDALDSASSDMNLETRIVPSIVPLAGAVVRPGRGALIGLSGRPAHGLSTSGASNIQLWADQTSSGATATQPLDFVYDWQPARVALAAGWADAESDVALEGVFRRWSEYLDHHGAAPEPGFQDTVEIGLSGRARSGGWDLLAGARWLPSPVPAQLGRTNYADADRYALGGGLLRESCLLGRVVDVSAGLQVQVLQPRSFWKDPAAPAPVVDEFPDGIGLDGRPIDASAGLQTNNPGYPGFGVDGWIWSLGVSLRWHD